MSTRKVRTLQDCDIEIAGFPPSVRVVKVLRFDRDLDFSSLDPIIKGPFFRGGGDFLAPCDNPSTSNCMTSCLCHELCLEMKHLGCVAWVFYGDVSEVTGTEMQHCQLLARFLQNKL